jgi:hypothetical protein
VFRFRLGLWEQWASGFPLVIAKFLAVTHLDSLCNITQIPLHRLDLLTDLSQRTICIEWWPSTYLQTGSFSSLAPVCDVIRWLDDADVPYCLTTDNPASTAVICGMNMKWPLSMTSLTSKGYAGASGMSLPTCFDVSRRL